ncbi:MAG: putative glycoside hydrolase [Patescibacteria group bacterium]
MPRRLRSWTALVLAIGLCQPWPVLAAKGISGSPAILNLYLNWQIREEDLPSLARWDVLVLDANQQARYPDRLRKLRQLNPSIKILAYVPSEEYATVHLTEPSEYPFAKLGRRIKDEWWAHDPQGNRVYFWPGQPLLDVTSNGRIAEDWNEFLPRFIHDEIFSTGMWDGVFLDNTFDKLSDHVKTPVDLDRDGRADPKDAVDKAWRLGMQSMLRSLRQQNPNKIIMGNGGSSYADQLNGVLYESFPSWSWAPNWKELRDAISKNQPPAMTSINVNTNNADKQNDFRLMRFGLGSALTAGSLYSFDKGAWSHDELWWYEEYEVALGAPQAAPRIMAGATGSNIVPAVWGRSFQQGLALVNSTNATQRVQLPGVFEKLRGVQDQKTNDGSLVTVVDVPAKDGLLLLRRSEPTEVRGTSFQNGTFVRVYDATGKQKQNGFFAQRTDAPSGATVLATDVDADGVEDLLVGNKGNVEIRWGTGKTTSFKPFGKAYVGRLFLAVGHANRDKQKEIIVSREGAPPEAKVFSSNGTQLARWFAYNASFSGGVRVAIGDLEGKGMRQIVTGAGPGGGPHVKIWKTDGKIYSGGFFAFDASETGGISLAAGDVDGDGRDEIVAASGNGSIPRVRIFDGKGKLEASFTLGDKPLAGGLEVGASDVDGDGKAEIVIGGLPAF